MADNTSYVAGVSTNGTTLSYGIETVAGQKPTAFTLLHRINSIDEVTVEPEAIDASALEDKQTRNIAGRDTVTENYVVTVNKTDQTVKEWTDLISEAQTAKAAGKRVWFQEITEGLTNAEFIVASPPARIPKTAKEQNGLLTMQMNCITDELKGEDTAVTPYRTFRGINSQSETSSKKAVTGYDETAVDDKELNN